MFFSVVDFFGQINVQYGLLQIYLVCLNLPNAKNVVISVWCF